VITTVAELLLPTEGLDVNAVGPYKSTRVGKYTELESVAIQYIVPTVDKFACTTIVFDELKTLKLERRGNKRFSSNLKLIIDPAAIRSLQPE
jgi:hypothetical protein